MDNNENIVPAIQYPTLDIDLPAIPHHRAIKDYDMRATEQAFYQVLVMSAKENRPVEVREALSAAQGQLMNRKEVLQQRMSAQGDELQARIVEVFRSNEFADAVARAVEPLRNDITGLTNRVTRLENSVTGLTNRVSRLENSFTGLENSITGLENSVNGLNHTWGVSATENGVGGVLMRDTIINTNNTLRQLNKTLGARGEHFHVMKFHNGWTPIAAELPLLTSAQAVHGLTAPQARRYATGYELGNGSAAAQKRRILAYVCGQAPEAGNASSVVY